MAAESAPEVLVLGPPIIFHFCEQEFSSKYRVLRSWESPLPLDQYLVAEAQKAEIVFTSAVFKLTGAMIRSLPSLRLIVSAGTGTDVIDLNECQRRGIVVTNTPSIMSADVADLAVGLLLDALWNITATNRSITNGVSPQLHHPFGYPKLQGKHVGIVGLGTIGLKVAKRLEPFGCAISYYSRTKKPSVSYAFYPSVRELAVASDILILCSALTEETRHLINRDVLLALGRDGVIVNVARGAVIDEKELIACLQNGEIASAGLDVYENEPDLPDDLLKLNNVVLSPHVGAFTEEVFKEGFEIICGNIDAFILKKPLLYQVLV